MPGLTDNLTEMLAKIDEALREIFLQPIIIDFQNTQTKAFETSMNMRRAILNKEIESPQESLAIYVQELPTYLRK